MTITCQCRNLVHYDPATQQYVTCDRMIEVPDSAGGDTVACPECGADVEVPLAVHAADAGRGATAADLDSLPDSPDPIEAEPTELGGDIRLAPLDPVPAAPAVATATPRSAAPDQLPIEVDGQRLGWSDFHSSHTCTKCGAQLDQKMTRCANCGTARYQAPTDDVPLREMEVEPAGFQLWMRSRLTSHEVSMSVLIGLHVLLFLSISVGCAGLIVTMGVYSLIFLVPIAIACAVYVFMFRRWWLTLTRPDVPLAWWQRLVWRSVLVFMRFCNWQTPLSGKQRQVLIKSNPSFSDRDLFNLAGLTESAVLDLSGTQISDESLRYLRDVKNLRFIVLTGTRVTSEGVFRLQQALRRAWIWY